MTFINAKRAEIIVNAKSLVDIGGFNLRRSIDVVFVASIVNVNELDDCLEKVRIIRDQKVLVFS